MPVVRDAQRQIICLSLLVAWFAHGATNIRGGDSMGLDSVEQQDKKKKGRENVYLVAELLDKTKLYANQHTTEASMFMEKRHDSESLRLTAAEQLATAAGDKLAIENTIKANEEDREEARTATQALLSMYYSLKGGLGAEGGAPSCEYLQCGEHASCVMRGVGVPQAFCQCKMCYEGNGYSCRPSSCTPTRYGTAMPLLTHAGMSHQPEMAEVQVQAFSTNYLAVVYRDANAGNRGFFMLVHPAEEDVTLGKPLPFSGDKQAFGSSLALLNNNRVVIAFRDENRAAIGFLTTGQVDSTKLEATFGEPQAFARQMAQHMVLIPLPTSRVVCLYAEEILDAEGKLENGFGGAMLVQVLQTGTLSVLGKYRFAEKPVARLAATSLTPTSFVVGYRAVPVDSSVAGKSEELSAQWMEMKGGELVMDPHVLTLEPDRSDMWARDLSLVSANLFAYSYQSGGEEKTKQAIIRVDPNTHHMTVVSGPKVINSGSTPYVQSISTPYGAGAAHTFTFFESATKSSLAEVCRVAGNGDTAACKELKWADHRAVVVSAAKLMDGRLAFVFADSKGIPHYQLLGAPAD